jgi:prephenate dehydratase
VAVTVVYPGREGAHSAEACERLFPSEAVPTPLPSFAAVVEAVSGGGIEFGVLPIESSVSGPVAETHDLLYSSDVSIVGEAILPIRHLVLGPARVPLADVRVVHSHPAALDQCRRLIGSLPRATAVAAVTTADAAAAVADRNDPTEVAIAGPRAARVFGLTVVAEDVGDHPDASTRFVALACRTRLDRGSAEWRTAFSFVTDHQPGALHRAIEPFARHGVDLAQLVSRPIPGRAWRYRFDAVLVGHPLDDTVRLALEEVRTRTRELKLSGSYPAAQ